MAGKRIVHTAAFKVQVALAALKEDRTINELAGQYSVHPTLIHGWKKQLLTGAEEVFGSPARAASADAKVRQAELIEQIGRLKMELEWMKKKSPPSAEDRRSLIEFDHPELSVRRQCELLGLSRSSLYYQPLGETAENLRLMRLIDAHYTACPFYDSRKTTACPGRAIPLVDRRTRLLVPDSTDDSRSRRAIRPSAVHPSEFSAILPGGRCRQAPRSTTDPACVTD